MFFLRKKSPKPFVSFKKSTTFASQFRKGGTFPDIAERKLGYGVIGNTTDSGPVIPGSSPGIPTSRKRAFETFKSLFLYSPKKKFHYFSFLLQKNRIFATTKNLYSP